MARYLHEDMPPDGLAFVAPVYWLHFPAIVKSWFERVFAYGSAYALSDEGWHGHASGRVPLMHHEKALVISTTLFSEADYESDWKQPTTRIIEDWGLRYPGVKRVEHAYFYEVAIADPARPVGAAGRSTGSAPRAAVADRARHLLQAVPGRRSDRGDCLQGVCWHHVRRGGHDRRRRSPRVPPALPRANRAIRAAHAAPRACGLRGLPRRDADHPEGARPRRASWPSPSVATSPR